MIAWECWRCVITSKTSCASKGQIAAHLSFIAIRLIMATTEDSKPAK